MLKTIYPYHDEQNMLLYRKVRSEDAFDTSIKSFYWERDDNGATIKNITDCRKVLYHLPQLIFGIGNNMPIFLVEGEKDVETLHKLGLIATTTTGSLEWCDEYTQILKDADVVILYDYDKTGYKRRDLLYEKLSGNTKRLRVVDLPGLSYSESHGADITDWLSMGHTKEELLKIVDATPNIETIKTAPNSGVHLISATEFLALPLPKREMILAPFFPSQGLVLLVAKRGVGKTFVALGIAHAISTGGSFFKWHAPKPRRVLYVDGEMPASLMQERLKMIMHMHNHNASPDYLQILTPDLQPDTMPDLSKQEGREIIQQLMKDHDLLVLDNLSCLFRSGGENESESWQEAQEFALNLRRQGKSILFVHHAGKTGKQRGTSKREDILDTVIILEHPNDYKTEEGARFEVHFDKTRHFAGEDARSFQAHLTLQDDNMHVWNVSSNAEEEIITKVAHLKATGYTIQMIGETMDLTKSQVETKIQKARERGLM